MSAGGARAIGLAGALTGAAVAGAGACYPDFQFESETSATTTGTMGTAGTGGTTTGGGSTTTTTVTTDATTSSGGSAVLPCGPFDDATSSHAKWCAPNESCCFAKRADGADDVCAEHGGCGDKKEYQCRSGADCGGGECCAPVDLSGPDPRFSGSRCEVACPDGEAELCDPDDVGAVQCSFTLECQRLFGDYGACLAPPATSTTSTTSTSATGVSVGGSL